MNGDPDIVPQKMDIVEHEGEEGDAPDDEFDAMFE